MFRCGNTTRPETYGQDACGKCAGDNSSCTDCEGVVNGGKTNDSCGDCKLKSDATFNSGCIKLYKAKPLCGSIEGGTKIKVQGAGLKDKKSAECIFVKGGIRFAIFDCRNITLIYNVINIFIFVLYFY